MAGLLARLARGTGAAISTIGEENLKDKRFNLETARLERLEDIRNNYAMERLERSGELRSEEAEILHGRNVERDAARVAASQEAATLAADRQADRDVTQSGLRRGETTWRIEEENRVENEGVFSAASDAQVTEQAKTLFDQARDGPGWSKNFDLDRWGGSKSRALADVRDRLREGWTESQIFDYLVDNKMPESTTTPAGGGITLDRIISEQVKPGVTESDVLRSILGEPRLSHLHQEARALLGE